MSTRDFVLKIPDQRRVGQTIDNFIHWYSGRWTKGVYYLSDEEFSARYEEFLKWKEKQQPNLTPTE